MSAFELSALAFVVALAAFFRALFDRFELRAKIGKLTVEANDAKRMLLLRTQLASEIAHEIKNPMTAIISSVEALDLLIGDSLEPDLKKSLQYIRESGNYTMRLLADFLDVNRFSLESTVPTPERVNVNDAVDSMAGLLRSYALKKHISLIATGMETTLVANVDPRHLKQIIFNLLHNALKFTPDRGAVSISLSEDLVAPRIRIIVQDTGPGIPEQDLPRIFDPYVQGRVQDPRDSGVGLGLALCKRLVSLAGGQISVSSALGVGTAFEFWIPKFVVASAAAVKPAIETKINSQAVRANEEVADSYKPLFGQAFLIIDDNHQSSAAIAKLIEAWGGLVDQVSQATEAVDAISRKNYDAVMVDKSAEGIHGLELASLIRDQILNRGTTLILASDEPIDSEAAQDCGIDKCIEKPLRGEELLKSLISSGKFQVTH